VFYVEVEKMENSVEFMIFIEKYCFKNRYCRTKVKNGNNPFLRKIT
jgi:hypothetical protein